MEGKNRHLRQRTVEEVYTPESQLRSPLRLLKEMWTDLLASRELAWRLMVRDISAQYRQSLLGIFWAFVPPIAMALGLTLANNTKVINIGATDLPYPAYVMFSMTLWQTFTAALNGPVQGVSGSRVLMAKINFPREAIILAKLGEVFFNFVIKLVLIVAIFLWFQISVGWTVLLAVAPLILLVFFGTFIGLLLTPLAAILQDFSRGLSLVAGFWLLLTPVLYPVPENGLFAVIVHLNPVTPLLVTTRELATTGVVSDPVGFWLVSSITLVGLLLAWLFYRLAMPFVIERSGA
jgi:lipopolysaccharide transport system permease protein